jgi:TolA-binding protein
MPLAEVWQVILVVAAVVGAAVYVTSTLVRQRHEELEKLAETRGNRIEDLEKKVDEQNRRIAALEGQMQAIQSIKAQEIAVEVVRLMREHV